MTAFFSAIWAEIVSFFQSYNWIRDTVDIALVAFVIYSVIKLVRVSDGVCAGSENHVLPVENGL